MTLPSLHKKVTLSPEWKLYEFAFTPYPTATSISAAFHVWNGTADIDDASLVVHGEKADEVVASLRFTELNGCSFDNGVLRPSTRSVQPPGGKGLVMEAEHAKKLTLSERGGAPSGRQGVLRAVHRLRQWHHVRVRPGRRRGVSGVVSGEHSAGGALVARRGDGRRPASKPGRHAERRVEGGHVGMASRADLHAGGRAHSWTFNNWHGGISLDQVALLPIGEKPPDDGAILTASPLQLADTAEAVSAPFKPYGMKGCAEWRWPSLRPSRRSRATGRQTPGRRGTPFPPISTSRRSTRKETPYCGCGSVCPRQVLRLPCGPPTCFPSSIPASSMSPAASRISR